MDYDEKVAGKSEGGSRIKAMQRCNNATTTKDICGKDGGRHGKGLAHNETRTTENTEMNGERKRD